MTQQNEIEKVVRAKTLATQPQNNPQAIARELQHFVQEQGLAKVLKQGSKPYVFSEGWTFLLEKAGDTVSTTVDIQRTNTSVDVIATATITHSHGGKTSATAVCSSSEKMGQRPRWDALHQIVSMAQTRAVSKASQLCYKHYMSMAGFATTPADEMFEVAEAQKQSAQTATAPMQASNDKPANAKQIGYIKKLAQDAGEDIEAIKLRIKTSADASAEIDRLKAIVDSAVTSDEF